MHKKTILWKLAVGIILVLAFVPPGVKRQTPRLPVQAGISGHPAKPVPGAMATALGRMPLNFLPNRGQIDPRVRFYLRAGGQNVYLTDEGIVFDSFFAQKDGSAMPPSREHKPVEGKRLTWRLDFEGANARPRIEGQDASSARFNYLMGNERAKWITDIPAYRAVVYRDIYPHIDLKLYERDGRLEYDLVANPGARLENVALAYKGIEKLSLQNDDLVAATALCEFRQTRPYVYQDKDGGKNEIDGRFRLLAGNRYTFDIGAYDPLLPLVIDPGITLPYSTFLGSPSNDTGYDIDIYDGFVYVTGYTGGALFPVTLGAYDTHFDGGDAFVAKIDPSQSGSSSLVWCTFLGGTALDVGHGIVANGGFPIICGETASDDFPQVNNGFLEWHGSQDGFVTELNASGDALIFSFVFGTGDYTFCNDIAAANNSVWVVGRISYGDVFYPASVGRKSYGYTAFADNFGDAYAVQFQINPAPVALGQVIVMGGSRNEQALCIAANVTDVYIGGSTRSDNFYTTAGAFDTVHAVTIGPALDNSDGFVARFNWGGDVLFSTLICDSGLDDYVFGISLGFGGPYVCGETYDSFPVVNGYDATRTQVSNREAGFMARLLSDGSGIYYSTYIETYHNEGTAEAHAIRTGGSNRTDCWVAGFGWPTLDYISGKNYYQLQQGAYDAFVVRIDTAETGLDSLIYGTMLGSDGLGYDLAYGVAGEFNNVYITGSTSGSTFPVANAYQGASLGGDEVFVSNLRESLPAVTTNAATGVYSSSATLNGTLTAMSGAPSLGLYFEWGTTAGGPYPTAHFIETATSVPHNYSYPVTGLSVNTPYYYRAALHSGAYGDIYGAEQQFSTQAVMAPAVTTQAATNVTGTTASSGGNVTAIGSDPVTARGVCWNTAGTPVITDAHTSNGTGSGSFTSSLTGLSNGTPYYVRAYATNAIGTSYGGEETFTTPVLATLSTKAATLISGSNAWSGGIITDDGGSAVSAHGVCWNTTGLPTTADTHTNEGAGSGSYDSYLTPLTPDTTYYIRAYAVNAAGTAYGNGLNFKTDSSPTVTTAAVTSITGSTAASGGNVTSDGGASVTCRGVCWNTTGSPTVADDRTYNGTGTGAFTSGLSGLTPGTTYYVRAYAQNDVGTGYGDELSFTTDNVATVTTTAASSITGSTAASGGNVTADGGEAVTARGVCWNTAGSPTISDSKTTDGSGTGAFTSNLTGLTAGTLYHVRAYATNSVGTAYGNEQTFTTHSQATLTTTAVSAITGSTAASGGNITSDGGETVTARGVCWNTAGSPTIADSKTTDGSGTGVFTSSLTGLTAGTLYHVRAYATNSVGTAYGNEQTFTTHTQATLTTAAVSAITGSTAASGGNVTSDGGETVTARGVCWNTASSPTIANSKTTDGSGIGAFTSNLTGLTSGTLYYVRAYATNSVGTAYGNERSFTTATIPTVTTAAVTNVSSTAAASGGNVTSDGGDPVTARGVCWNTAASPTIANSKTTDGTGTGAFTSNLTGLLPVTTYYVRAYATNSVGTAYGNERSFTTTTTPTVTTAAVTGILGTSAVAGGNVTSDGGDAVTARGVCWNTTGSPTIANNRTINGAGVGAFTSSLTGLTATTTYFIRAYATNALGTAYGGVVSFTTLTGHNVTFVAGSGGVVSGTIAQCIEHGCACTPVTAVPNTGYSFSGWSGTGGFSSSTNPLTLTNVLTDMNVTANFANVLPTIRIVAPLTTDLAYGSVNVLVQAGDDQSVERVDFFVDGAAPAAARLGAGRPASRQAASSAYTFVWNTLPYANGPHRLRAVATDNAGTTAADEIVVTAGNVLLSASGQRFTESAWIIRKTYVKLQLTIDNSGGAPAANYIIYRRAGSGLETVVRAIAPGEVVGNRFELNDPVPDTKASYTYRVVALTAAGALIGQSNLVVI